MLAPTAIELGTNDGFCRHQSVRRAGRVAGRLSGTTFALKDVFAVQGITACYGNPTWLATHTPAERTAPAVQALLDAGATLVGLTLTDELALSLTGENAHYGTPVNPNAPGRVPGGSSSGSACAVAAGLVSFALGTDTGGSVRVPASHTGVFGFRPSHAAVSCEGVLPLAPRFDAPGWFARDAPLLDRVGDVLLPPSAAIDAPARLLVWPELERFCDPEAWRAASNAAVRLASALGVPLAEHASSESAPKPKEWLDSYFALQNAELRAAHGDWIAQHRDAFGALIGGRMAHVLAASAAAVLPAETRQRALCHELTRVLATGAWLVVPSAPGAAPLRGLPDAAIDAYTTRALTLCAPASLVGLPQLSLPLARSDAAPLGISLIGARGSDRALLRAAVQIAHRLTL